LNTCKYQGIAGIAGVIVISEADRSQQISRAADWRGGLAGEPFG
jgi:hypothetical protein